MVHQEFQVPKMEVLTYICCMDTAYVRENPSPKWPYKVQETLHFRYLKLLVTMVDSHRNPNGGPGCFYWNLGLVFGGFFQPKK